MDKGGRSRTAGAGASPKSGSGLAAVKSRDGTPRHFQLAAHTIHIRIVSPARWKHGKNCVGIWLPDQYRIEIVSSCRGSNRAQVLCHEAIHAMLDIAGHDDLSRDEQFVDRLGHLLAQMLTTLTE
jgi:hypothetical protein